MKIGREEAPRYSLRWEI